MTLLPAELAAIAQALYGQGPWKARLAGDLGVTPSLVRRWARGDAPVPHNRVAQLYKLVKDRRNRLDAI